MAKRHDPRALRRLTQLCAAQQRLALQAMLEANANVETAVARRTSRETAVIASETAWRTYLGQPDLGPDIAVGAANDLVGRAYELRDATEHEAHAKQALAARQSEQQLNEARHRQAEALQNVGERIARRRSEERLLAAVEDRTAHRWSKT